MQSIREKAPSCQVILVTKGRSVAEILEALQRHGLNAIGENRVEEAEEKFGSLPAGLEKHFIGGLQSRKIPRLVQLFDVVHSVDKLEQLEKLDKEAGKNGKILKIFVQIKLKNVPERQGILAEELPRFLAELKEKKNLHFMGLMGLATPLSEASEAQVLAEFQALRTLAGPSALCSMGMSEDWPLALQAGSDFLRLGRVMFS